jgi:flagellar biosynthesis protein FliQ
MAKARRMRIERGLAEQREAAMDSAQVIEWSREALRMALILSGPPLLAALVIGIVVGIAQTMTQMHEPVVGLIPRLIGVALVVLIVLPWLFGMWVGYASELIESVPNFL